MPPRKFTDEQIALARKMRKAGHTWKEIEAKTRPNISQAVSQRNNPKPRKPPAIPCEHCGILNHIRRYFCKECGIITTFGKSVN